MFLYEVTSMDVEKRQALLKKISDILRRVHMYNMAKLFYRPYYNHNLKVVRQICASTIEKYKHMQLTDDEEKIPRTIYWLWLQGENNSPELVKTCLASLPKDYKVVTLNSDDIEALPIDANVKKLHSSGLISHAFYSDVVRAYLLSHHGGIWCDATLFVNSLPSDIVDYDFYSTKRRIIHSNQTFTASCFNVENAQRSYWTSFFLASKKGSVVTSFMYDMFVAYLSATPKLVDYFLVDLVIRIGYEDIPLIKRAIDSVPINNNGHLHDLTPILNKEFSDKTWALYTQNSIVNIFKLNYRVNLHTERHDTFYAKLKSIVAE